MEVFKRLWRLKIQIGNTLKTYQELDFLDESLKIDFDITNQTGGAVANGNISITGLNNDDMQVLSSCYNPQSGVFKGNFVSLEAGYNGVFGSIIRGNINGVEADFLSVDRKISLKIMGSVGNNLSKNNVSTSLNGSVDFKAVCLECAKNNNLGLKYDKKIDARLLNDFSFNGSPFQMIDTLRGFYNDLDILIDENANILQVLKREGGEVINKSVLSKSTGLLGRIKPTQTGCIVRSLLNVNLKAGGFVKLENDFLKQYDGLYRIFELKHRGTNRGDLWETELNLYRAKGA